MTRAPRISITMTFGFSHWKRISGNASHRKDRSCQRHEVLVAWQPHQTVKFWFGAVTAKLPLRKKSNEVLHIPICLHLSLRVSMQQQFKVLTIFSTSKIKIFGILFRKRCNWIAMEMDKRKAGWLSTATTVWSQCYSRSKWQSVYFWWCTWYKWGWREPRGIVQQWNAHAGIE